MHIWNALGIDPSSDSSVIKRAYAKQLKLHHPEEDPEGYQRLREAYDQALRQAKQQSNRSVNRIVSEEEVEQQESQHVSVSNRIMILPEQDHVPRSPEHQLDEFMGKVKMIYNTFISRIDTDYWLELMNDDVMWNVNLQRSVYERMLNFLESHPYLPRSVWQLLEGSFRWKEKAQEDRDLFSKRYPNVFIYALEDQQYATSLRYSFLADAGNIDYDAFLHYRVMALRALKDHDLQTAEEMLNKACEVFPSDPDLLRLQGEFYFRTDDLNRALIAFDHCIRIAPDDMDSYFYRSRIYYKQDKLVDAIQDLDYLLSKMPENLDMLSLLGKCYIKLGQLNQARESYHRILDIHSNDIEALVYLADFERSTIKQKSFGQSEELEPTDEMELQLSAQPPLLALFAKIKELLFKLAKLF
ncbi:tetratricopeptide repeat protein [Paenibacillus sp. HWE-109]|uniref:J domain-containing protein n=1 Tax=Paenibacillus sp. HWE-109 TaxID=1306526 RepID=UPI001EDF660B|nr:J domain-containing protein [Paenibacillus sp. HWE-109]UKS28945.1 tetratricopeptide repeat protein [Paenibacillus sp. HWE-109]